MPLSAALWDLDGTIVDTAPIHWLAWRDTLAGEGRTLTHERFATTFGLRNDQTVGALYDAEVSDAEIARIGDAKEARFRERVAAQPPVILPGALYWLASLRSAGWRQALATMAPRPNLEVIVAAHPQRRPISIGTVIDDLRRRAIHEGSFIIAQPGQVSGRAGPPGMNAPAEDRLGAPYRRAMRLTQRIQPGFTGRCRVARAVYGRAAPPGKPTRSLPDKIVNLHPSEP